MKYLLISLVLTLPSCSSFVGFIAFGDKEIAKRKMKVCLTTYHKGEDYWTNRGKSSSGATLVHRRSAAVDPAIIPYGSIIKIEECGLELVAVDTGSDVKSKKASRARGASDVPVVDIYFENKKEALTFAKNNPYFTTAEILTAN